MPRTHRGKPLTWQQIKQIGLGELGMHPWEFRKYTMQPFIDKLEGFRNYQWTKTKEQWKMVRALAFDHATMQGKELRDKKPSIYKYWPLPWDEKKGISAIQDPQKRMDAIMELRRKYLKAAKISKN